MPACIPVRRKFPDGYWRDLGGKSYQFKGLILLVVGQRQGSHRH
jgi:hypothetical protein